MKDLVDDLRCEDFNWLPVLRAHRTEFVQVFLISAARISLPNGCHGSRGIAYDERSEFLFAGCAEGKAVVLDARHDGKVLGTASVGDGVDIIDPVGRHLFIPG